MLKNKPRTVQAAINALDNLKRLQEQLQNFRNTPGFSSLLAQPEMKDLLDKFKKDAEEEEKEIRALEIVP